MDKIKAMAMQLLTIWQQLGINQKVTVAASGLLVAGVLAAVVFFTSRTDFVLLYGNLDAKSAGKIITTLEEQKEERLAEWGEHGRGLADHYLAETPEGIYTSEVDYNTDAWFARPNREILNAMSQTSADVFMYLFTRNLREPSQRAPHAMELRYVFQTLPDDVPEADRGIADLMSDYWVQFATSGNPNRDGVPVWPGYDQDRQEHQIIGAEVGQGSGFRRLELDALDGYFAATYAGARH